MVQIFQTEKGYGLSSQLLVAIFRIFPIHLVFPVFPSSSIATIYVFHINSYLMKVVGRRENSGYRIQDTGDFPEF
jgi:hypothetical protein